MGPHWHPVLQQTFPAASKPRQSALLGPEVQLLDPPAGTLLTLQLALQPGLVAEAEQLAAT